MSRSIYLCEANFRNQLKVWFFFCRTLIQLIGASDSIFIATLFTSDSEQIMRYTDEGETTELCKWTVDLSSLPSFRNNAASQPSGFYTGKKYFRVRVELAESDLTPPFRI